MSKLLSIILFFSLVFFSGYASANNQGKVLLKVIDIKDAEDSYGYPLCKVSFRVTNETEIIWVHFGLAIKGYYDGSLEIPLWSDHSLGPGEKEDFFHLFEHDMDEDLTCKQISHFSFAPNPSLNRRSVRGKKFKDNYEAHRYYSPRFSVDPNHNSIKFRPLKFNHVLNDYYGHPPF